MSRVSDLKLRVLTAGSLSAVDVAQLTPTIPVNVTGVVVSTAGMINGEGTGLLKFYSAGQTCTWTPPGGTEGAEVEVASLAVDGLVTLTGGETDDEGRSKFIILKRTADALPTDDAQDDLALTFSDDPFLVPVTGAETESGVSFYRAVGVLNDGLDTIESVAAFCLSPFEHAENTTIAAGGDIGTGMDDELIGMDLGNWGSHGWVYNVTKNDVRYFYDRSGNTAKILDPDGGMRGFTAVAWDVGDALEPLPWFDIGIDPGAPGSFADPDVDEAPGGVVFTCPRTAETGIPMGDMASSAEAVVWERYTIPAGFSPLNAGRAVLRLSGRFSE